MNKDISDMKLWDMRECLYKAAKPFEELQMHVTFRGIPIKGKFKGLYLNGRKNRIIMKIGRTPLDLSLKYTRIRKIAGCRVSTKRQGFDSRSFWQRVYRMSTASSTPLEIPLRWKPLFQLVNIRKLVNYNERKTHL